MTEEQIAELNRLFKEYHSDPGNPDSLAAFEQERATAFAMWSDLLDVKDFCDDCGREEDECVCDDAS